MVKLTKIYTRTGDTGQTQMAGGRAVAKSEPLIKVFSALDELNAMIGWVNVLAQSDLASQLLRVQNSLFNLGAQLAVPDDLRRDDTPRVLQKDVDQLEQEIDMMNESLPMLNSFILPGGNELASRLHIARTVCRRAECELVVLNDIDPAILKYINRLSDWLFVSARYVLKCDGNAEILWEY